VTSRPRNAELTRQAILEAARARFLTDGFAATTTRLVAADAGVDAALVIRYFQSKQGLWERATDIALDLPDFTGVPPGRLGERLVAEFLDRWEGEQGPSLKLVLSAAATNPRAAAKVRAVFTEQARPAVAAAAPDRVRDRVELVVTTLLGLATCRYVLRLPSVARRSPSSVASLYAPALQQYLTGQLDG
jgi:AcrR family transcriptional regulator